MDAEKKYKIKAFFWDQFIRPIVLLLNIKHLQAVIIGLIIVGILTKKTGLLIYFSLLLLAMYAVDITKYYTSGEYMNNYKNYKYPEYRQAIKEVRKQKKKVELKNEELEFDGVEVVNKQDENTTSN